MDYSYLLDPDGPRNKGAANDNLAPYLVHCTMNNSTKIGYSQVKTTQNVRLNKMSNGYI